MTNCEFWQPHITYLSTTAKIMRETTNLLPDCINCPTNDLCINIYGTSSDAVQTSMTFLMPGFIPIRKEWNHWNRDNKCGKRGMNSERFHDCICMLRRLILWTNSSALSSVVTLVSCIALTDHCQHPHIQFILIFFFKKTIKCPFRLSGQ